jgi:hypothetical protein
MNKILSLILVLIVILVGIYIFYPKDAGGTCGFCPSPPAVQRIEYDCIGFKYEYNPKCPDCGIQIKCIGIVTGSKKCYTYLSGFNKPPTEVPCREAWMPSSPMSVDLSVSPFTADKVAELTVTITSVINAPNTTAQIILPEGIELQSGSLTWNGDIPANSTAKFSVIIKAVKKGEWIIEANAKHYFGPDSWFGGRNVLYFIVCEDVKVSLAPSKNNWYEETQTQMIPLPENNEMIKSNISLSELPELNKEVTLTYTVTPSVDIPDPQRTYVTLVYPPKGFEVISAEFPAGGETYRHEGQLTWKGSINKDQTVQIKVVVKMTTTGSGTVYGHLSVQPDGKTITKLISDVAMLDIKVGECYATVERK